jgi:hypothetical protein
MHYQERISDELFNEEQTRIRRLINQAIFNALYVCDETITEAEFAKPFAALRDLHNAIHGLPSNPGPLAERRQRCPANAKGSDPYRGRGREPFRVGSISNHLMRRVGIELTRPFGQCLLRASRLPFRHRRND